MLINFVIVDDSAASSSMDLDSTSFDDHGEDATYMADPGHLNIMQRSYGDEFLSIELSLQNTSKHHSSCQTLTALASHRKENVLQSPSTWLSCHAGIEIEVKIGICP